MSNARWYRDYSTYLNSHDGGDGDPLTFNEFCDMKRLESTTGNVARAGGTVGFAIQRPATLAPVTPITTPGTNVVTRTFIQPPMQSYPFKFDCGIWTLEPRIGNNSNIPKIRQFAAPIDAGQVDPNFQLCEARVFQGLDDSVKIMVIPPDSAKTNLSLTNVTFTLDDLNDEFLQVALRHMTLTGKRGDYVIGDFSRRIAGHMQLRRNSTGSNTSKTSNRSNVTPGRRGSIGTRSQNYLSRIRSRPKNSSAPVKRGVKYLLKDYTGGNSPTKLTEHLCRTARASRIADVLTALFEVLYQFMDNNDMVFPVDLLKQIQDSVKARGKYKDSKIFTDNPLWRGPPVPK